MGFFQSQPLPASSSAAAADAAAAAATASPRWMVLAPYAIRGDGKACHDDVTGDAKTIAAAALPDGRRINVSLRREPSSAAARIGLNFLPCSDDFATSAVIAAHGGSVLLEITSIEITYKAGHAYLNYVHNYFVYSNVAAAVAADRARPPSLCLLPVPPHTPQLYSYMLDKSATGFLCRGEAEFVVAELRIAGPYEAAVAAAAAPRRIAFELQLFRRGKWCAKQPLIIQPGCYLMETPNTLLARWQTTAVVPLGNGMLCWVDRHSGVIFSDVFDEGPNSLRYVPYPAASVAHRRDRFVCTNVHGALKLVSMAPPGCSHCGCCEHDTDFNIWTLNTDDMAWVLETETNMVDTNELWMLPDAPGYARAHLVYPADPNINGGSGHVIASVVGSGDHVSEERSASVNKEDENVSLTVSTTSATSVDEEDENRNGDEDAVSEERSVPMEEEDEHMGNLSVSVSTSPSTAMAGIDDVLQGGNGATSAATSDQQQGDNGPATMGRWPKRRRRANSMVTGPEWIA